MHGYQKEIPCNKTAFVMVDIFSYITELALQDILHLLKVFFLLLSLH